MKSVMTIAGSDSSGGAGIEADIKTIEAHKLFATCAITALTAQNTTGVYGVEEVSPGFVAKQIEVVCDDIFPDAIKIGMVSNPEIIVAIADTLCERKAKRIVVDPVMVATSGSALIEDDAVSALRSMLFPLATIITPNIPEGEVLSGMEILCRKDMEIAAQKIQSDVAQKSATNIAVMLKGGHETSDDGKSWDLVLTSDGDIIWLDASRVETSNTHGTGCTLSSAIACGLATGLDIVDACAAAKSYVHGALSAGLNLGHGSGPINHMWNY